MESPGLCNLKVGPLPKENLVEAATIGQEEDSGRPLANSRKSLHHLHQASQPNCATQNAPGPNPPLYHSTEVRKGHLPSLKGIVCTAICYFQQKLQENREKRRSD